MKAPLCLKPAVEGQIVRDESMRVLAKEGSKVPNTPFWRRRIADGSAVAVSPPPAKSASKPQPSTGKKDEPKSED